MPAQMFWLEISLKYEFSGLKMRICDDLCIKLVEVQSYVIIFIILTINPWTKYLKTHLRNDEISVFHKSMIITCIFLKITAFDININMKIAHKITILCLDKAIVFRLCSAVINIICTYCSEVQLSSHVKFVSPFVPFFTVTYRAKYVACFLNLWIILSFLWPGAIINPLTMGTII